MLLGIPIALGSWWGLLVIAAMMPELIWRLNYEEKFLARNLGRRYLLLFMVMVWGMDSAPAHAGPIQVTISKLVFLPNRT